MKNTRLVLDKALDKALDEVNQELKTQAEAFKKEFKAQEEAFEKERKAREKAHQEGIEQFKQDLEAAQRDLQTAQGEIDTLIQKNETLKRKLNDYEPGIILVPNRTTSSGLTQVESLPEERKGNVKFISYDQDTMVLTVQLADDEKASFMKVEKCDAECLRYNTFEVYKDLTTDQYYNEHIAEDYRRVDDESIEEPAAQPAAQPAPQPAPQPTVEPEPQPAAEPEPWRNSDTSFVSRHPQWEPSDGETVKQLADLVVKHFDDDIKDYTVKPPRKKDGRRIIYVVFTTKDGEERGPIWKERFAEALLLISSHTYNSEHTEFVIKVELINSKKGYFYLLSPNPTRRNGHLVCRYSEDLFTNKPNSNLIDVNSKEVEARLMDKGMEMFQTLVKTGESFSKAWGHPEQEFVAPVVLPNYAILRSLCGRIHEVHPGPGDMPFANVTQDYLLENPKQCYIAAGHISDQEFERSALVEAIRDAPILPLTGHVLQSAAFRHKRFKYATGIEGIYEALFDAVQIMYGYVPIGKNFDWIMTKLREMAEKAGEFTSDPDEDNSDPDEDNSDL